MGTTIPAESRATVQRRDERCVRCGSAGPTQWHHRRSRRVVDTHQHCAGNGVSLCGPCHAYVHAHPAKAREAGLIVSVFVTEPDAIPVKTYRGWLMHDHTGRREPFPAAEPRGTS